MFFHKASFSLHTALTNLRSLFVRFPAVLLVTVVGTILAWNMVGGTGLTPESRRIVHNMLMTALLAFPWVLLAGLLSERFRLGAWQGAGVQLLAVFLISPYYLLFSPDPNTPDIAALIRLVILGAVATLLCFFLPFATKDQRQHWQYAAATFQRAVAAACFGAGLAIGLTLAILAVDYLFQLFANEGHWIARAWSIAFGIVASWFFLAGVPRAHESPSFGRLPRIVELFLNYIWMPVITLFFVILYVYVGKIVVTGVWPKDGVSAWILAFSIIGFLAFFVSYDLLASGERKGLRRFFTAFFALVIPLVVVLFIAIGIRINSYGLTEQRALVVLGGIWLTVASIYYLFSRATALSVGPYAAAILLLVSVVGPWNIFSLSVNSQVALLRKALEQHGILVNGVAASTTENRVLPFADIENIRSKVSYIAQHGAFAKIAPWFPDFAVADVPDRYWFAVTQKLLGHLRLTYQNDYASQNWFTLRSGPGAFGPILADVRGYDFVVANGFVSDYSVNDRDGQTAVSGVMTLNFKITGTRFIITQNKQPLATVDLTDLVQRLIQRVGPSPQSVPESDLVVPIATEHLSARLLISEVQGYVAPQFSVESMRFTLIGRLK